MARCQAPPELRGAESWRQLVTPIRHDVEIAARFFKTIDCAHLSGVHSIERCGRVEESSRADCGNPEVKMIDFRAISGDGGLKRPRLSQSITPHDCCWRVN